MPSALAGMIAIPLAAQLACQPVLLLLNPSLPLYGVAANMLAEPAAPVATVLGLIACLLMPIVPGLGYACAQLAWLPSAWIAAVARTAAGLPGSQLPWLGGAAGVAVMALAAVAVMVLSSGAADGSRRIVRSLTAVVLLAGIGVYAGTTFGSAAGARLSMPNAWQVGACDIGQGDAVLIHDGAAHGLVDVGPDPKPLNACLSTLGVDRIDLLVLTHYDKDHVGGLQAVVGRVGTALVGQPTDAHDRSLVESLVSGGADVRIAASGDHGTLGALDWRVLWPTAGGHSMQTGNEGSVTVRFDGDGMSSVYLGDLDEHAQSALLASGRLQPADLVKVAHHGSADQSERLYQALNARVALISAGLGNDYGHPTARLLGILARGAIPFYRTDLEGIILVVPHPDGALSVWTERSASAEALRTPGRGG
jgi:competence protein ComEC